MNKVRHVRLDLSACLLRQGYQEGVSKFQISVSNSHKGCGILGLKQRCVHITIPLL